MQKPYNYLLMRNNRPRQKKLRAVCGDVFLERPNTNMRTVSFLALLAMGEQTPTPRSGKPWRNIRAHWPRSTRKAYISANSRAIVTPPNRVSKLTGSAQGVFLGLTYHPIGSARKAAQSGELKCYISQE
jgi:hypothetical protein